MSAMNPVSDDPEATRRRLVRFAGVLRWLLLAAAAAIPLAVALVAALAPDWVLNQAGMAGLPVERALAAAVRPGRFRERLARRRS